jgi:hypothetical protein
MKKNCTQQLVIFSFPVFTLLFIHCHKAGSGGQAEVAVYVKHHSKLIPGATVYVKYNAKDFPGTDLSKYDQAATCGTLGEAQGHTHIKNLKYGYYYFYSEGYDSSIMQKVTGGIPFHIKYSQRKEETELDVPVTE